MNTPEEIKKLLANHKSYIYDAGELNADALAYIKQLEEGIDRVYEQAKRLRQQFEAQSGTDMNVPRWISVEDEMPEDDVEVLVYAIGDKESSIIAMTSYTHHMHGYNIEGWRSPWQYFFYNYKITHWMPLPEPPKEQKE